MTDLRIIYPRTPERVVVLDPEDKKEAVGLYGRIELAADLKTGPFEMMWRDRYVRLAPGTYRVIMDAMGNGLRCFRFVEALTCHAMTEKQKAVLAKSPPTQCIHSAMRPYELEGCIAPGTVRGPEGWAPGNSSRTMKQIFDAFQGWTPQRHFVAEVIDE